MCKNTETNASEGKTIWHRLRSYNTAITLALAIMIVLLILVIPLKTEYRVYVTIGQDVIIDASAQTVTLPLISTLFPAPSYPTGIYTIEVKPQLQSPLFLYNVPIGQYTFVLQNITSGVTYTITVTLIKNSLPINTFTITVTF
jgi:hypothetical protein